MAKLNPIHTIIVTTTFMYTTQESEKSGTFDKLLKMYQDDLKQGAKWSNKVNINPKTIRSLIIHLNRASDAVYANKYGTSIIYKLNEYKRYYLHNS